MEKTLKPPQPPAPKQPQPPAPKQPEPPAPVAEKAESGIKIDLRQIYFNAVLGGIGGLLGWLLMSLVERWLPGHISAYAKDALVGPLIGLCIGFCIGSSDGLVVSRSMNRWLRGASIGAVLGAIGGLIGLLLGEWINQNSGAWVKGNVMPKALGWGVFGMLVGTSDGFAQRLPGKIRYGIIGGLLGGLIGGSCYQGLFDLLKADNAARAWGSAIGLIILGACIGALVGLVESLLRKAWLFFVTGRLEGQTITLDSSRPHTIGTAATCSIIIPGDRMVKPVHAEITCTDGEFTIHAREGEVVLKHEGTEKAVKSAVLHPNDRIRLGDTRMNFRG